MAGLFKFKRMRRNRVARKCKYHFIHIPKNGGNSVRKALKRRGDVSVSRPLHYRYIDISDQVGRDLRFFCIVRNPWSRTASRFAFAKQNCLKWHREDPRRIYMTSATFEDYVRDQRIFDIPEHPGQPWMGPMNSWFNQLEWIRDEDNKIVCDSLRLEFLDQDLSDYFGERIIAPRHNMTRQHNGYRELYTGETAAIVADIFKDDIEHFGFTFDNAATKNIATGP